MCSRCSCPCKMPSRAYVLQVDGMRGWLRQHGMRLPWLRQLSLVMTTHKHSVLANKQPAGSADFGTSSAPAPQASSSVPATSTHPNISAVYASAPTAAGLSGSNSRQSGTAAGVFPDGAKMDGTSAHATHGHISVPAWHQRRWLWHMAVQRCGVVWSLHTVVIDVSRYVCLWCVYGMSMVCLWLMYSLQFHLWRMLDAFKLLICIQSHAHHCAMSTAKMSVAALFQRLNGTEHNMTSSA